MLVVLLFYYFVPLLAYLMLPSFLCGDVVIFADFVWHFAE